MYGEIMAILHGDYAQIISLLTIMKSNLRSAPYLTSSILFYNISLFMKLWTQQCKEILFQTLWLNNLEPFTAMIGTKNNKEDTYFINNFKTIATTNKQPQTIVWNKKQRAKLFHYLETYHRVWQKPIECYVTCHSVHFSLWSNWTGCPPNNMTILEKVDQCKLRKAL